MHKAGCNAYARWQRSEVMGSSQASAYTKASAAILELNESSAFIGCVVFTAIPSGLLFMIRLTHLYQAEKQVAWMCISSMPNSHTSFLQIQAAQQLQAPRLQTDVRRTFDG